MQEYAENEVINPQNNVKKAGVNKYRNEEFRVERSILFTVRIKKIQHIIL